MGSFKILHFSDAGNAGLGLLSGIAMLHSLIRCKLEQSCSSSDLLHPQRQSAAFTFAGHIELHKGYGDPQRILLTLRNGKGFERSSNAALGSSRVGRLVTSALHFVYHPPEQGKPMRVTYRRALVLSLIILVAITAASESDRTVVKAESGAVRGVEKNGVISWKGIPYAAPPVGKLRWRVPQPAISWVGVREASQFGPACMQTDDLPKSEDCLTLNVWRPSTASGLLPVMVWIYGGAMVHGNTAMYPGDALAAQGVVMVSMNYRMGRFGFFAHPALATESPNDVRGNYGYMDQLAALKWVQRNIAAFGGDPKLVTIFGESAGGGSVMSHLESPMSRGLFQRAILQSPGTPGARAREIPTTDLSVAEKIAVDWAHSMGATGDGAAALEQLRALSVDRLLEGASAKETLAALAASTTPSGMAMSILDGKFLTERPEQALAAGHMAPVPTVIGANDRDLGLGTASSKDDLFASFGAQASEARKLYDSTGDQTLEELKQQVFADRMMIEPVRHFADEMARAGNPVWLYRFAYVSESQRGQLMGTIHGFEIPFTFDIPAAIVKDNPSGNKFATSSRCKFQKQPKKSDTRGQGAPFFVRDPADLIQNHCRTENWSFEGYSYEILFGFSVRVLIFAPMKSGHCCCS